MRGGEEAVTLLDPVEDYMETSVDVAWTPDGTAVAIGGQSETSVDASLHRGR